MYLQLAGEEDKKTTENWKGDADGILISVSRHSTWRVSTHIHPEVEDWFILRRRRSIGRGISPGPQAKFPGHLSILPRKHVSNPRRFEWLPDHYSPHPSKSVHPIFYINICRVGQLTLVSQFGHQSHMCAFGDVPPAMGASVHEVHSDTIQSTQTSTCPGVFFGGRRETPPSAGTRRATCIAAHISFPVLRAPRCVPFRYQSYGFQRDDIVDRILYRDIHVHHIDANVPA